MKGKINYRKMNEEDILDVVQLLWVIFQDMGLPLLKDYSNNLLKDLMAQAMTDPTFRYHPNKGIVAEQDNEVVGVIFVYPGREEPFIDQALNRLIKAQLKTDQLMFTDLETTAQTYYLDALVVHPKAQKQGIAKGLVNKAKKKAKEEGFHRLDLNCEVDNMKAKALYKKLGFRTRQQRYITGHLYDEMTYFF